MSDECKAELDKELSFPIPGGKFVMDGWEDKQRKKLADKAIFKREAALGRKIPEGEKLNIREYWANCELRYTWDGRKHFYNKGKSSIPTGLIRRAAKIIKAYDKISIVDKRELPGKQYRWRLHGITLFDDQLEAVRRSVERQRGIIQAPTGFGKTVVIGGLTAELGRKTLILIHREAIFQQLYKRMYEMLRIPIGRVKGSLVEPDVVTVAMIQTVSKPKYVQFLKTFPVVIIDEAHHVPAATYNLVMNNCINAYFRYGFSATPWREQSDEMEIEANLAGFIVKISPSSLIKVGRLARPNIFFLYNPALEHFDRLSWQKQYVKCIVENDYRNTMACRSVEQLWKRDKTCLLAVTQIRHGKILLKMLNMEYPRMRVRFINGSIESQEKQLTLKLLDQRKLDCVIATTVFGEGVDVPSLDAIINCKGNESKIETYQLIGRALRKIPGKNEAYYIDFADQEHYTKKHAKTRFSVLDEEELFECRTLRDVESLAKALDRINMLDEEI